MQAGRQADRQIDRQAVRRASEQASRQAGLCNCLLTLVGFRRRNSFLHALMDRRLLRCHESSADLYPSCAHCKSRSQL